MLVEMPDSISPKSLINFASDNGCIVLWNAEPHVRLVPVTQPQPAEAATREGAEE